MNASLQKTVQDRVAYARKKLAEAEAEVAFTERVATQLPDGLPDVRSLYGKSCAYLADGVLSFEVADRAAALAILAQLPGVPATLGRGTFVTIGPTDRLDARDPDGKEYPARQQVAPFVYSVDAGAGFRSEHLAWWHRLADGTLLKVNVEVKAYTVHVRASSRGDGARYEVVGGAPHGSMLRRGGEAIRYGRDGSIVAGSARWEWFFAPGSDPAEVLGKEG